ncbi:MAG: glycosyltransferase family 9 protein [Thermoguttaceae bacterium]|nr:glycosyltransferase family 9 protein [Thermoguttaceae bacterium]
MKKFRRFDYYGRLNCKIAQYRAAYGANFHKTTLRLAFWAAKSAFRRVPSSVKRDENALNVGLYFSGGLGDYLIAANYFGYLKRFVGDAPVKFSLYAANPGAARVAFVDPIDERPFDPRRFDLFISTVRFPLVERANRARIKRFCPRLTSLIDAYRALETSQPLIFSTPPLGDGIANALSVVQGRLRLQQPDVDGLLGIGTDFDVEIPTPTDEDAVLRKFGLEGKSFVTLNRGIDAGAKAAESTKMWPLDYYVRLVADLKRAFPERIFVQLGVSEERSPKIAGVDVDLVGKTNLDEVKILLKRAESHIDGEGGMTHLRRAMKGGPSVVLFGPTEPELYGYPQNLNLRAPFCRACEWAVRNWSAVCPRTGGKAECMERLTPEFVAEKIVEFWRRADG